MTLTPSPKNRTCEFPRIRLKHWKTHRVARNTPLRGAHLYVTSLEPTTEPSEAAPARGLHSADISALPPQVGLPMVHVDQHQREVCRLSPRGDVARRLNPYPPHYRAAFACSLLPYPPPHRLALRLAFPDGETTGLPRSAGVPLMWVRSRLFAGGSPSAPEEFGTSGPGHVPFGPSDSASCAWPGDDV